MTTDETILRNGKMQKKLMTKSNPRACLNRFFHAVFPSGQRCRVMTICLQCDLQTCEMGTRGGEGDKEESLGMKMTRKEEEVTIHTLL